MDDDMMIFHSISSGASEKYKDQLDKFKQIITQENTSLSQTQHKQQQSNQDNSQANELKFQEILRNHRDGLENELESSAFYRNNQLKFSSCIKTEQDILEFYEELVCFLHLNLIEQQISVNNFNNQMNDNKKCLIPQNIQQYYIELCQYIDRDNILQVLKSCEANKSCIQLTYKIMVALASHINEYFETLANEKKENIFYQLFQFVISYEYQGHQDVVLSLLQNINLNYKSFITQYRHFQNINSITNVQIIIRLYIQQIIADLDYTDSKQVQEVYDVIQNLHPDQKLLQRFSVHLNYKQGQSKLQKYYELLLTIPNSQILKPYSNNVLLLLLFVSAHTLEQKVTLYQLLKKYCFLLKKCNTCNNYYQFICDYCENGMVLSNQLRIVQLIQSLIYNSYYDQHERNNVKYLLNNAFTNDKPLHQVSQFQQQVDYIPYIVFIVIQQMNYELEVNNVCVDNFSSVNQATKKSILSYLIEKSLVDKSLDFIYLLDENNEQTNIYVLNQLTTRYYKANHDIRLTSEQLLYILLYFSKHSASFEKQNDINNLILYIIYHNADTVAFDFNFQQLGLYVLNLIHLQNRSALEKFITQQENTLVDTSYFQIIDMLSSNGHTEYKQEKLCLLQIFCYLITRQTEINITFIHTFLSYILLAISNQKLSKQMLLSCKLLIQWIMLIFIEKKNPYEFKPIQILKIAIVQKNNFIIRIILQCLHLYHVQSDEYIKSELETLLVQCLKIEDPHILYYSSYLFRKSKSSISKKIMKKAQESYLQALGTLSIIDVSYIIQYQQNKCIKIISMPSEVILQQSVYYGITGQLQFQTKEYIQQISNQDIMIKSTNQLQQIQQSPDIFTCVFAQQQSPIVIQNQSLSAINNFNDTHTCYLSKYLLFTLLEQNDMVSLKMPPKLLEYLLRYNFDETIQRVQLCIQNEQEKLNKTKAETTTKQYNETASQISYFCSILSTKIKEQLTINQQLIGNIINNFITQQHLLKLILQLTQQSLIHPYDSAFYALYFLLLSKVAGGQCVELLIVCKRRFQVVNMFKRALSDLKGVIEILKKVDLSCFFNIQHIFRILADDKNSFQMLLKNIAAVFLTHNTVENETLFCKFFQYITCFLPFDIYDDCLQWFADVVSEYEQLEKFKQQIINIYSNSKKFKQDFILQLAQDICKQN